MNLAIANLWKHPKTTITGALGFIVATSLLLAAEPQLAMGVPPKLLAALATASALSKLILNVMSKDTGREEAKIPGKSDTQMVDATETPVIGKAVPPEAQ